MMDKQPVCGLSTVLAAAFCTMLCFHPLLITVAPCPTSDWQRVYIFCLDCWVQQRPPFRGLVPEKHAFPSVVGRVQCFLSAFGISSIADAHHFLDGTAMLAPKARVLSANTLPRSGRESGGWHCWHSDSSSSTRSAAHSRW